MLETVYERRKEMRMWKNPGMVLHLPCKGSPGISVNMRHSGESFLSSSLSILAYAPCLAIIFRKSRADLSLASTKFGRTDRVVNR